jgi:hypothetical protein
MAQTLERIIAITKAGVLISRKSTQHMDIFAFSTILILLLKQMNLKMNINNSKMMEYLKNSWLNSHTGKIIQKDLILEKNYAIMETSVSNSKSNIQNLIICAPLNILTQMKMNNHRNRLSSKYTS